MILCVCFFSSHYSCVCVFFSLSLSRLLFSLLLIFFFFCWDGNIGNHQSSRIGLPPKPRKCTHTHTHCVENKTSVDGKDRARVTERDGARVSVRERVRGRPDHLNHGNRNDCAALLLSNPFPVSPPPRARRQALRRRQQRARARTIAAALCRRRAQRKSSRDTRTGERNVRLFVNGRRGAFRFLFRGVLPPLTRARG